MAGDIPTLSAWKTFRTLHGAPDKNVTKALTAYWNSGADTPKKHLASYTALEKELNTYITKLSTSEKKKIKEYDKFQQAFLDKYLGMAHKNRADTERGMAGVATYKAEVVKFMAMVQKLDKNKTTAVDLGKFKSGPARGLSAMASQARGLNQQQATAANAIRDVIMGVDNIVDHMPAQPTKTQLSGYVTQITEIAEQVADLAEHAGLA